MRLFFHSVISVLRDDELSNFFLVGAFRDENPELVQPFRESTQDLLHDADIADIAVVDLKVDEVNEFVASTLSRPLEETRPLAQVIHRKTAGNPYFMVQLLKQLHAQNFLTYNFGSLKWEWDVEGAIAGTNVSDNVVDAIATHIQNIPTGVQRILKLAACVGFVVDSKLLCKLLLGLGNLRVLSSSSNDSDDTPLVAQSSDPASGRTSPESSVDTEMLQTNVFEAALNRAEEEGFVERTGSNIKFTHDMIHKGFYDMIGAAGVREKLHFQIGLYLKKYHEETKPSDETAQFLFLAVDQLNRGSSLVDTDERRISLIKLNYEVCKVAKKHAGIEAISSFLRKAIDLVQPSFWIYYYELILEVFNSSAEVDFSLGKLDVARATISEIMTRAVREVDKVRAMVVEFQMYGLQCEYKEAISHGGRILKLLGEPVPKKVTLFHVAREYFRARKEAKNKNNDYFINRESTESTNIKIILRILQVGSVYGWNGDVNFAGFAMLRGFRISMREGTSDSTPYLYCGYGFMLGLFGEYVEAFRFGQLAQKTRSSKETFPSAINLNYTMLSHLQLPVSVGLEPLLSAYRVGLETGDLFYGTVCLACYVLIYWHCGLPLGPFAQDLRNFGEQLRICHQDLQLAWLLSAHQLAMNLMGETEDPLNFSREAIIRQHEDLFSENLLQGLGDESSRTVNADILFTWYLQLYNAYILEDVAVVEKTMKRLLKLKSVSRRFGGTHCTNYFLPFIDGLAGLFLSKKLPRRRIGPRVTKAALVELTKMSKSRPINSITPLKLIQAELYARKKSTLDTKARAKYNEAINEFSRSGMNHFCAIANELAGKNMLERGETDWAALYLESAMRKWAEYHATVKVQLMVKKYSFLEGLSLELTKPGAGGTSIQGRSRFDATTDSLRPMAVGFRASGASSTVASKEFKVIQ